MTRVALGFLLASSLAQAQTVSSSQSREMCPPVRFAAGEQVNYRWLPEPVDGGRFEVQPGKKQGRLRRMVGVVGLALVGTGAALLATSDRTRQVPAVNCSFYPAPFVPCIPAHTEKTRSRAQDGIGGGAMMGGFVMVYVWMGSR